MVGREQTVEDDRLCFPAWRITVHLAALHTAVGAEKQISPGTAVPTALRRKPHEFLVGGKAEVVVEPGRMVPYQSHELLIHCSDAFGSAAQGIGLCRRQDHTLEAKAWLAIEPGIIEDTGVVEIASKISISRQCIVYHRSNNTGQKQRRSDIRYRFQEPGSDVFIVRDFTVQQTVTPVHRASQEEPLYQHLTNGVKHQR